MSSNFYIYSLQYYLETKSYLKFLFANQIEFMRQSLLIPNKYSHYDKKTDRCIYLAILALKIYIQIVAIHIPHF